MRNMTVLLFAILASILNLKAQSIIIGSQDDNWHPFSITTGSTYTLSYDFTEHNYDSDGGESDGWRQSYSIDWNTIETVGYAFEIGNKLNPEFLLPKSSVTFTSINQTGDLSTKIDDSSFGDNTGNIYVDLTGGPPALQGSPTVIGPQNSDWHSFSITEGQTYRIDLDFSEHNYDSDGGESDGWRQLYSIDWNTLETVDYTFEIGNKLDPEFLLSYSSLTFIANQTGEIKIKIRDSSYGDNTGNIYIYFNQTTVGIPESAKNEVIRFYPNPVKSKLTIEKNQFNSYQANIYNSLGEKVYCEEINANHKSVDFSGFNPGIYLLVIKDCKENIIQSDKIVKE